MQDWLQKIVEIGNPCIGSEYSALGGHGSPRWHLLKLDTGEHRRKLYFDEQNDQLMGAPMSLRGINIESWQLEGSQ